MLIIKTTERRHWRRSGVFVVKFEHIFTPCSSVSIVSFEHVFGGYVGQKSTISVNYITKILY